MTVTALIVIKVGVIISVGPHLDSRHRGISLCRSLGSLVSDNKGPLGRRILVKSGDDKVSVNCLDTVVLGRLLSVGRHSRLRETMGCQPTSNFDSIEEGFH